MMARIVPLIQGSPEWLAHRQHYRNASETPAVLGESPWLTPYQLWQVRTGKAVQEVTPAMAHGTQWEPFARQAYEDLTGLIMQPLVLVDGSYSASLDGMTLDRHRVLEIKCPYQGTRSKLWQQVSQGELPEHYRWQVQHQLMVSGSEVADLFIFAEGRYQLLHVPADARSWDRIHEGWDAFMQHVVSDTPPDLTDRDKVLREDPIWLEAAARFIAAKQLVESATTAFDQAKSALVDLAKHPSECGGGVSVTRFWKQGSVDYKKVPELREVDLDAYRGKGREEVRVIRV